MNNKKINSIKLDKHLTKDIHDSHENGSLTVIWRDWDKLLEFEPKMVYVTSIKPGEIKGPHLHTIRDSCFVCIHGKVVFVIQDTNGEYLEIESSEENPVLICVPPNFLSGHINIANETSTILTLANPAWRPNDNEMKNIPFEDYDWEKWKIIDE